MRIVMRAAVAIGMIAVAHAEQHATSGPAVVTNETYVNEAVRSAGFDLADPLAVFAFVLNSLPQRVNVYPTENFYYFRFMHDGVPVSGNIRLDVLDRDQGTVRFAYFEDHADWKKDGREQAIALGASHGVIVERLEPLHYRVSYRGKLVEFVLNDVSQHKPPPAIVGRDEVVIGPIFDESAMRFFLVFNAKQKTFHYLLDETGSVADRLVPSAKTDRILIGTRTGFAFYRDHRLDRKILIGAFDMNSRLNNYFDGPFDQLPENFIEGDILRDAIIAADPEVKGEIDRLGHFLDGSGRYAVHPYMLYKKVDDLYVMHRCATDRRVPAAAYYRCFVIVISGLGDVGRPLALRNLRGSRR
jgi:hypothetical protein